MRHAEVAYFGDSGRPRRPDDVMLTPAGEEQARAARDALAAIGIDRVVTSGLRRTVETARIVSDLAPEEWPELAEIRSGALADIPDDELEEAFVRAWRGVVPEATPFLGGETVGELFDRVLPALERLLAGDWDALLAVLHGGVNRAILSYALTGARTFLGSFEQAPACVNVLDVGDSWVVRAVGWTPYDPAHRRARTTTMEELWEQYRPYRAKGATRGDD
ncbi:MAG: histidine phosphatase family protein [Thermoleophilia bacterium]|nr:histidine phosphatase family protein [Thermoleophilia bacterium]